MSIRGLLTTSLAVVPGLLHAQVDSARKVSARLWDLVGNQGTTTAALAPGSVVGSDQNSGVSIALVPTEGGSVVISAIADTDPNALAAELVALGLTDAAVAGRVVSGRIPVSSIPSLANVSSLRFARPSLAVANIGSVTSQGDRALKSDLVRGAYGLTGTGVTVGILSDSFDNLGGMAAGIASQDLPASILVLKDFLPAQGRSSDEGRAMAELVTDVAPGAALAFYTAWNGEADFANGIRALKDAGCRVIVDDVIYLEEPMFADGVIAQAVNEVAAAGVAYFSAAGNAGKQSYASAFRNSGQDGYHDFDPGTATDISLNLSLNLGTTWFVMQWADRYASTAPGNLGAASDLDLEVRIYTDETRTEVRETYVSDNFNLGADPVETLGVQVGSAWGVPAEIRIRLNSGVAPALAKIVWYTSGVVGQQEYATQSSTLYGHMNAAGALAVGASRYCNTPAYGITPPTLETWSAVGGTPIYYLPNGTPAFELRSKPDFTAPQGANTTFFGSTDYCGLTDDFPNFYGTSAAAPHAAGLAALMLQSRPGTSPEQIRTVLKDTAVDMKTAGFDFESGSGLIQADAALARLTLPAPVLQSLHSRKTHGTRGDFDLALPLTGKPGVEGRNGSSYKLVFRFNRPISAAQASVTAGTATLAGPVTISGTDVVVPLSGVANRQWLTVMLREITAADGSYLASATGRTGILFGDVDGDGRAVSTDILVVRSWTGVAAGSTSFRSDVDVSGVVNSTDYLLVRQFTGSYLPAW